jgi:hypothetical protein
MKKYLAALAEDQPQRSSQEYLGAFTESLKLIQHENPVERIGHAVLLAATTALRLKAVLPHLREFEIAQRLQTTARGIRLMDILKDVTPEERSMFKWSGQKETLPRKKASRKAAPRKKSSAGSHARPAGKSRKKK